MLEPGTGLLSNGCPLFPPAFCLCCAVPQQWHSCRHVSQTDIFVSYFKSKPKIYTSISVRQREREHKDNAVCAHCKAFFLPLSKTGELYQCCCSVPGCCDDLWGCAMGHPQSICGREPFLQGALTVGAGGCAALGSHLTWASKQKAAPGCQIVPGFRSNPCESSEVNMVSTRNHKSVLTCLKLCPGFFFFFFFFFANLACVLGL